MDSGPSSPASLAHLASSSAMASPVIRRSRVTYGRRRELIADADTSPSTVVTASSSRASPCNLWSSGADESGPPNSDDAPNSSVAHPESEETSDEDSPKMPFGFAWRKGLKDIDNHYNQEDLSLGGRSIAPQGDEVPASVSRVGDAGGESTRSDAPTMSSEGTSEGGQLQNHLTNIPDLSRNQESIASRSPSPFMLRRRRKIASTVHDSDIESSNSPDKSFELATHGLLSSPTPSGEGTLKEKAADASLNDEGSEADNSANPRQGRRRRSGRKEKERRMKAPTRREREEAQKATARIVADRSVSIQRSQTKQIRLTDLFAKIKGGVKSVKESVPLIPEAPTSDPIQPFSSSPTGEHCEPEQEQSRRRSVSKHPSPAFISNGLLGFDPSGMTSHPKSDGNSDIPEVPDLQEMDQAHVAQEKQRRLVELKHLALKRMSDALVSDAENDDSDLEVVGGDMPLVAKDVARARRTKGIQSINRSVGKLKQRPAFAVSGDVKSVSRREAGLDILQDAAAPTFARQRKDGAKGVHLQVHKTDLNRLLLHNAEHQAQEVTRTKEEEWVRRGGRIKSRPESNTDATSTMLAFLSKGLSAQEASDVDADAEGDAYADTDAEPDSDEDRSSTTNEDRGPAMEDLNDDDTSPVKLEENVHASTSRTEDIDLENDEEDDNILIRHKYRGRGRSRRPVATVQSDEEETSNSPPLPGMHLAPNSSFALSSNARRFDATLSHRSSTSSFGDHTEDGTDKENDSRLLYDRGEDKENTAVATQLSLVNRPISVRSGGLLRRNSALHSPFAPFQDSEDPLMESTPFETRRPPLQELPRDEDEDDPFAFSRSSQGPARRLIFSSEAEPIIPVASKSSTLHNEPMMAKDRIPKVATLEPGFSNLFASNLSGETRSPKAPLALKAGGLSQFWTQETGAAGFDKLRAAENEPELSLTLDSALQPALELGEDLRRKADDIFEKEQEYLAQGVLRKPLVDPQLYVNANGFLTQTKPTMDPFELTQSSVTQISLPMAGKSILLSSPAPRQPLAAIEPDQDENFVGEKPRGRLVKRTVSPLKRGLSSGYDSLSPSPKKPRNAFDVMRSAAFGQKRLEEASRKLRKSEFIEGEAEESDDDAMMGFGIAKGDDEESEDESQDQTLAELVDDADMDQKTLAEDAVLEKHREHVEEDDQALEKLHQDAIEGKFRTKRRDRGVGFDDSGSESDEDDETRARRRNLLKKRKIEGDSLEALAKDPRTLPFVQAYHADMADGDDFAHLQQDEMTLVDDDEQDLEDDPKEYISANDVREQLREAAAQEAPKPFNPNDVSWMDHQDDGDNDDDVHVKEVRHEAKRPVVPRTGDWDAMNMDLKQQKEDERDRARLQSWAKHEPRTTGGARSTGMSAVTGGGRRKPGGTSGKAGQTVQATSRSTSKAVKANSTLSAISSSRRSKFQ